MAADLKWTYVVCEMHFGANSQVEPIRIDFTGPDDPLLKMIRDRWRPDPTVAQRSATGDGIA
jgi:hypothetical protein